MIQRVRQRLREDFEMLLFAYFGVCAAVLAALVGRPWLGAIGLLTVAPFLGLAWARARR